MAEARLYTIGTSTTLESNKSLIYYRNSFSGVVYTTQALSGLLLTAFPRLGQEHQLMRTAPADA
jgi:hypothetical protein